MVSNKLKSWRLFLALSGSLGGLMLAAPDAQAVPSMARQTGYECAKCHTVFPELTPFGRQFKLGAFTNSSDKWDAKPVLERLPFSGALKVSQAKTSNTETPGAMPTDFPQENKLFAETVAAYYGGKITNNSGALVQYNYDGVEKKWAMEMFDVRFANSVTVAGRDLAYGVTLNNSPTVSDIYNSTPSWGFPNGNGLAKMPAATLVDMTLASKVGGVGVYGIWNDLIYAEVAGYRTAKTGAFRFMGWGVDQDQVLDSNAPYWRLALQQEIGPNSFEVGTYGLVGDVRVNPEVGGATDHFRDIGFDASYQYIKGPHIVSAHGNWIREKQTWDQNAGRDDRPTPDAKGTLNTFRADVRYSFKRTWSGALGYFETSGSSNNRYNTGDAVMGSANASPDAKGWITEVNYLTSSHPHLKLSLRYTAFQKFNGASTNYVPGRNASDNNNLYLTAWLPF